MDAKLREDLFRRYVASLERRLEEGNGGGNGNGGGGGGSSTNGSSAGSGAKGDRQTTPTTMTHSSSEEALVSTATALLGAYQPEPTQRFRLVRFYEVAENALRSSQGTSLKALEAAFATLETVCTNLLLFPWKKEFRCIKTFTGPYVYQLQSAMCESDLRLLLRSMGYTRSELDTHYQAREAPPGGALHLRQLAFELLLAQAECRLLGEVVALARGAATELEALELRRASREDAAGCAEALRRRDSLTAIDMARLSLRPADMERAATPHHHHHHHHHHQLRRSGRPSKSVDVTDSAGHWHPASKPVLRTSLSLRKEPLFVDAEEEDARDEILRPNAPLFSLASTPSYSPSSSSSSIAAVASAADFFPIQSPPPPSSADPYSYHLSSLDEVDLYTERGVGGMSLGGRQTPSSSSASASSTSRPPSREPRDGWMLKAHGGAKCQGCGLGCSVLSSCQRCDTILCSSCLACEPTPCCCYQDYPKVTTVVPPASSRQLDGYLPAKEKLSVYSSNAHVHSHVHSHTHPHAHVLSHAHMHPHPHPHPLSHSQLLDKPMMSTKLYPNNKPVAMVTTSAPTGIAISDRLSTGSSSRCGFCNKPGAAHTCVNCSKTSCDSCMGLYGGDTCTRKTPHHNFLPNHQLNYKSSTMSHLVYR